MDLVGPLPESMYGNKYFFTILDDYSRYKWVLFLKSKDSTFATFYKWFINIKNLYNTKINICVPIMALNLITINSKNFASPTV